MLQWVKGWRSHHGQPDCVYLMDEQVLFFELYLVGWLYRIDVEPHQIPPNLQVATNDTSTPSTPGM